MIEDIKNLLFEIRKIIPYHIRIIFELGNYWFENSGFALGKIIDISKNREGKSRITLDLSKNCHLKWSEPKLYCQANDFDDKAYFYGPTCYEGDFIGEYNFPIKNKEKVGFCYGEAILLKDVDIYSASWNHSFNGVPRAEVIFYGI